MAEWYRRCSQVSPSCPVEATTLGYSPNLGANVFFCVTFGVCAVGTLAVGVWKRTWTFALAVTAGCLMEVIGKIYNPLPYKYLTS